VRPHDPPQEQHVPRLLGREPDQGRTRQRDAGRAPEEGPVTDRAPDPVYDAACRRAISAQRDRRHLERADVLTLLDGQPDAVDRDRTALALARAGLLGIDCDLRELFAEGAPA
jgi:hypothetical protein